MHPLHWLLNTGFVVWFSNEHIFVLLFAYLLFFALNLCIGTFARRYRKVLETSISVAAKNTVKFIADWILIPFAHKVVFIFTDRPYRKYVIAEYKKDIHASYKKKLVDLKEQIHLLDQDRGRLSRERLTNDNKDEVYWAGVKYGFSIAEKNRQKVANQSPVKRLNESQVFTLRQIAGGNKTVSGLIAAYLEDNGFVRLVCDNASVSHYETTEVGLQYLKRLDKKASKAYDHYGED